MPVILAIDDDTTALSALATTLEGAGYEVQRQTSIGEAREFLDEQDPDLVVLEVDTGDGAGWNLLRDIVRFAGPPSIIVTRRGREEEVVEALSIGAADVLPKPYRTNELLARVRARLAPPPAPPKPAPPPPAPRRPAPIAEEPVFMGHADERALLQTSTPVEAPNADELALPLGARLHAIRQRRKLTLVQVNLDTKIPMWYLQAMEEEKFSLLPRGPVAVEMIRTYANYLGLDASHAVADYHAHHDASPFKPIPSLGGSPEPREISPWTGIMIAALLALVLSCGSILYFAPDQVGAFGSNLRTNLGGLVTRPTATVTPSPTVPTTVTPTTGRPARTTSPATPTRRVSPTPEATGTATTSPTPGP